MSVTVGGLHFEDTVADFENGDIEGAATQVVNGDLFVGLLVEAVGERRGGRLVDDAEHVETGDLAGVLRGLTLGIVVVSGNGDDGLRDGFAETAFGVRLELGENHGGNFLGAELLRFASDFGFHPSIAVIGLDDLVRHQLAFCSDLIVFAPHEALDGENGVLRVGDRLTLGGFADETLAVLGEGHHRGSGAFAFGVFQYPRLAPIHDAHAGVGRAQIDA